MSASEIKAVHDRNWERLNSFPNVLNTALATKIKDGKDTGIPAIVVYVEKKVSTAELATEHLIPPSIEGVPTDVVELSPTTWKAGKTAISQLSPEEQLKRLGHRGKPVINQNPKIKSTPPTFSQSSDLRKWASPIQNQQNCGECVGYGGIGVIEGKYRVQVNNANDPIKLSEDDAFFCSGGGCNTGNDVPTLLNYIMNTGVCSEACQPSKNIDIACGYGRCAQWWLDAKKLKSWTAITDIPTMKAILDIEPLIVVMAVPQSFFNYSSGTYKRLGSQDPIVGYHCIGVFGHNEPEFFWGPVRNSWGTGWGEQGYFNIAFGECEIDSQMWQVVVDLNPVPAPPGPTPAPPNPPKVLTLSLPAGRVGTFYNESLQVKSGTGTPPFIWSIVQGQLPGGLSLSPGGTIYGAPTVKGQNYIVFSVTDSANLSSGVGLTLTIKAPACSVLKWLASRKNK